MVPFVLGMYHIVWYQTNLLKISIILYCFVCGVINKIYFYISCFLLIKFSFSSEFNISFENEKQLPA